MHCFMGIEDQGSKSKGLRALAFGGGSGGGGC